MSENSEIGFESFEEEIHKTDPLELLTSNEIIDNFQMYDATIEVIGYIDGIESPRICGNKQQYKVLKFYLNNGTGRKIQIIAWNDVINRVIHYLIPNHIIHLDGVQARIPKMTSFNKGNVSYELLIRDNTVISNLGKYEPQQTFEDIPLPIKLEEILNTTQRIILEVYVKTNFTEAHDNQQNKVIGIGSITDGTYKMETHILNFNNDEYWQTGIIKGDKIEIIGVVNTTNEPAILLVNNIKDLHKLEGYLALKNLLKGVQVPRKRKIDETVEAMYELNADVGALLSNEN